MTSAEQRRAAKKFAEDWKDRGYEKGESQPFWMALLRTVFGISEPEKYIFFEDQVHLDHTSFIDATIPSTHVLIEQKGIDKDLRKPIKQSDGSFLTPFQQAKRYSAELPYSDRPRWIVTCNFASFLVYDMENPAGEPEEILLKDLPKEYSRLSFLTDVGKNNIKREMELSLQAGDIVGKIYDEILKHYRNPEAESTLKSLNILCVRLVFCLYAEDAGIFPVKNQFHDYLARFEADDLREALINLFRILDTPGKDRSTYEKQVLLDFPYVNGGLFAEENIEIPQLDENVKKLLLAKASDDFDWSEISPTIFGAVFESTLNPETRRSGGMHYTSIENIHKVIDPLFLDDLKNELDSITGLKDARERDRRLIAFQEKLASLTFLDPACGSGNFLTETYLSLRKLENRILEFRNKTGHIDFTYNPILVSIGQFYGIEINDFAVSVAKTALWISESQMMKATEDIVHMDLDFLPLKSYANIVEGNALRIDWSSIIPKRKLNYIMGNPPFCGYTYQTDDQKFDLQSLMPEIGKKVDYVSGWYFKAAAIIQNTPIRTAFVSTNSITQGEQVALVWKPLYDRFHIHIDFAHRTFRWDSEANLPAHVHCVIIGFSHGNLPAESRLYDGQYCLTCQTINPYLNPAPIIFIESRKKTLCPVPELCKGSQPTDGGNFILRSETERQRFIAEEPDSEKYIRQFLGSDEFINAKKRFCFWLAGANPAEIKKCPQLLQRINAVKEFRLKSTKAATRKMADFPTLFTEIRQPDSDYLAIPEVSSEKRFYVPIGFLDARVVCSNKLQLMPNASLFHFGVLTSLVHMAWMRTVCGRLEKRYDYSVNIVYNNFPWPDCTSTKSPKATELRQEISETAQWILDARALYPVCSLADLYDEVTMPPELRKAHQANDRAVMKAYGFDPSLTEPEIVAKLMDRYQKLAEKANTPAAAKKKNEGHKNE